MGSHCNELLDVGIPQRGDRHEHRRNPFFTTDIHPIQHQHMEVRMQIQRAAEALDKGHRATTDIGVSLCGLYELPKPHCEPFRRMIGHPPITLRALAIVGFILSK